MLMLVSRDTSHVFILCDAQQRITWVNDAFSAVLGYTPQEALGQVPEQLLRGPLLASRAIASMGAAMAAAMRSEGPSKVEAVTRSKGGADLVMSVEVQPLGDGQGLGFVTSAVDITEQATLRRTLSDQTQELLALGSMAQIGTWRLDMDTMRPRWSAQVRAIHEVSEDYQPTDRKSVV